MAAGADDVLITGGGIIPAEDVAALAAQGVGQLFGPGTDTRAVVDYIRAEMARRREGA